MVNDNLKIYFLLYFSIVLASLSSVIAAFAGYWTLFSIQAIALYCLAFFMLGVYAIMWQQVLKKLPLTIAYSNRAISILLGVMWGVLLFSEDISLTMIIGLAIVLIGVVLVVRYNE